MNSLRLYLRYVEISLRSQLQYRASFFMLFAGQFVLVGVEFAAIAALFDRFGSIRGWQLPEIALFYGVTHIGFAFAEGLARGFDTFDRMVKMGEYDRLLLRPRSTLLQVAGQEVQLMRLGRLFLGGFVLAWGVAHLGIQWSLPKMLLICFTDFGAACLFYGILILQATIAFWTVESLEILNIFTYGGTETGQYPLTIYSQGLRSVFTYLVPIACVNYIPLGLLFDGHRDLLAPQAWHCLTPLAGCLFLWVMTRFWRFGERHYVSTGS